MSPHLQYLPTKHQRQQIDVKSVQFITHPRTDNQWLLSEEQVIRLALYYLCNCHTTVMLFLYTPQKYRGPDRSDLNVWYGHASGCCLLSSAQLSTQSHHEADLKTKHSGLQHNTLQMDIGLPDKQTTQTFQIGRHTSSTLVLNTWAPQGCVLSPLLFTLYTHDCAPRHQQNSTVKYEDDITIVSHIINSNES